MWRTFCGGKIKYTSLILVELEIAIHVPGLLVCLFYISVSSNTKKKKIALNKAYNEVDTEHAQVSGKMWGCSWQSFTQFSVLVEEKIKRLFMNVQGMYHFLVSGLWAFLDA